MFYWDALLQRYKVLWPIMSEVRKTVLRDLVCTYVCIEIPRSPAKIYFTAWVSSSVSKHTVPLDHLLAVYGTIEFANPVRNSSTFFHFTYEKTRGWGCHITGFGNDISIPLGKAQETYTYLSWPCGHLLSAWCKYRLIVMEKS